MVLLRGSTSYPGYYLSGVNCIHKAENKDASNVNDSPLLAFDMPNQNLTRTVLTNLYKM